MTRKSRGSRNKSSKRRENLLLNYNKRGKYSLDDDEMQEMVNNTFDKPENHQKQRKTVKLTPRGANQIGYVSDLLNPDIHMVFAIGPAGTGKTMLATQAAVKGLADGTYDKIVITRPNVDVDDQSIGFLPGGILDKMSPYIAAMLDVFKETYSPQEVKKLISDEIITVVAISQIRGRTFKKSLIIIDESQNTTPNSLLAILTRIGEGSKMIITGDLCQTDHKGKNGLLDFLERYERNENKSGGISVNKFNNSDICRHPIITEILNMYGL